MTIIIKKQENTSTGLRFEFRAIPAQKKFAVMRSHKEAVPSDSVMRAFGVTESYVDDEECIFDDFFEADKVYDEWLANY